MEKGSASARNTAWNSRASLLPPRIPIPATSQLYEEYVGCELSAHHRRTSSESFPIEKPSWFDELLDEPETPVCKGGHRRSSSDSSAYTYSGNTVRCSGSAKSLKGKEAAEPATSKGSAERNGSFHEPSPFETDTKCAKGQYLRPRFKRQQRIAKLEWDVQALEAETSGASARLEFIKHQHLIIGMENIVLKRRIAHLTQDQLVKRFEHEALEREVVRLRALYHQQQCQMSSFRRG